jgi:hypothetical protein
LANWPPENEAKTLLSAVTKADDKNAATKHTASTNPLKPEKQPPSTHLTNVPWYPREHRFVVTVPRLHPLVLLVILVLG